jgi:hypothetical protein
MTMPIDWGPLDEELAEWRRGGRRLVVWWRDDDAAAPSAALDALAARMRATGLAAHLAVIPAAAEPALAARVAALPGLRVLAHGWTHANHAPPGEKKAEFGAHRPAAAALAEAAAGRARLSAMFGPMFRPVFVPPWNRIAPAVAAGLPGAGFGGVSTYGPRQWPAAVAGLAQVNCHVDPVDWHGSRSLADPARQVRRLAELLAERRAGRADAAEPLGILTHHLAHDHAIWRFFDHLVAKLLAGGAAAADIWDETGQEIAP